MPPEPLIPWRPPTAGTTTSVAGAVARFALTGAVVLVLVGLTAVEVLHHAGRTEAIRDARRLGELAGHGIVQPAVSRALLDGDPAAIARMDRVVRERVRGRSVVRVKLWDARGRVVYADDHRLIGALFPLPADERAALATGRSQAEISDLSHPENRFERRYGKLMEVYLGIRAPSGQRLLFETYQRYSSVASSGRRLWLALLPVLLGALVLLAVLQVPLAWSLARRVRRSEQDRLRSFERAIDAQQQERGRIARDLHDSVVQHLAGVSFRLGAAREHADEHTPPPLVRAVEESVDETRESIRALRSLLVDIYPPSLQRQGLVAALSDLMARTARAGVNTHLDATEDVRLAPATEELLFRTAQEALRNVIAHAGATHVDVAVRRSNGHVVLSVTDDGAGFEPAAAQHAENGHFGLVAIGDLVHDEGGTFRVDTAPGQGTTLRVEVPAE